MCVLQGGQHQVFQHFGIVLRLCDEFGADADAGNGVAACGGDFHQSVACLPFHFGLRQLCLRFFHVFLHFLRLLHQAAKSCFAEHIGILLWVWFAAA